MDKRKPKDIPEYIKWLKEELNVTISMRDETHFESVTSKIKSDFEKTDFWKALTLQLNEFDGLYFSKTNGYHLFAGNPKPDIYIKSYTSFLEKSYRSNIVFNKNWPRAPNTGWVTPTNWYEKTNDIIRTCFIVKYLDGVEFLKDKISEICNTQSLDCEESYQARDEGYYAVHLYTKYRFQIPKLDWDTEEKQINIELQITTQLQDVIGKMTHKYYEDRRIKPNTSNRKWQWDYNSEEFTANYLGHILHYVEGMIMDVRQKQQIKISANNNKK